MSDQLTVSSEIILKKRNAWADLGESIYNRELKLQARAQQAILSIVLPLGPSDLEKAEALLKELRATQISIEGERKEVTVKFNDVATRMMEPEKSLIEPISKLSNVIISIKKSEESKNKLAEQKIKEIKSIIEQVQLLHNSTDAKYKTLINETVLKAYNFALGTGNITPDKLASWMKLAETKLTLANFPVPTNYIGHSLLVSDEEYREICQANLKIVPAKYIEQYKMALSERFKDYDIAYKNKEDALKIAEAEKLAQQEKIKQEEENKKAAAKLNTATSIPIVMNGSKPLKKSYEIDMPETCESAMAILGAFVANMPLCLPKLRINKWFSFTAAQAANALGKVKSDENEFHPQGLTFKQVDKL